MAVKITNECINCGACKYVCPNGAVYEANEPWNWAEGTQLKGEIKNDGISVKINESQLPKNEFAHYVVSEKCTECVEFYEEPQCMQVCPIGCCVLDERKVESKQDLLAKKKYLHQE